MRHRNTISRPRGFSLVEVLVALIVISVGLLGVAKMQALALSSTTSARMRSLAAIQAASLASSMHTDRAYWAAATPVTTVQASNAAVTSSDANLQAALTTAAAINPATDYCIAGGASSVAPCQPAQLAAADLQSWGTALFALIPNSTANISCDGNPLICKITLAWRENLVAVNTRQLNSSDAIQNSTYVLYVQP